MTPEELVQTCPRLPKPVRTEMTDLLVHMARVQESISGFIHDQLSLLESLGYSKLPENDDDVDDLHADYSLSEDPTGKPPEVPSQSWKYVMDSERPLVQARWDKFSPERRIHIAEVIANADIDNARPKQRPYVLALVYANPDAYFHVEEENPPLIKGFEFSIETEPGKRAVGRRPKRWFPVEQAFLKVEEAELVNTKKCRYSYSEYRNLITLVPYVDRIKAFLEQEHAADRMNSPLFAHVVSRFYRLTIDMRLLNQITLDDQHPLPKLMDVIDRFYGNKHFVSHDVQDAFWAVPLKESDRHKTVFEILYHLLE